MPAEAPLFRERGALVSRLAELTEVMTYAEVTKPASVLDAIARMYGMATGRRAATVPVTDGAAS
jgi:hypothetical protein